MDKIVTKNLHISKERVKIYFEAAFLLVITCLWLVFVGGCVNRASLRVYPDDVPYGSLRLVEVMFIEKGTDIPDKSPIYNALLKSGIPDKKIKDGNLAVGRIYCCGGTAEVPSCQAFYVPGDVQLQPLDVVEIQAGREPDGEDNGQVNVMTRVVQHADSGDNTCRWVPLNPNLWMRVLYCDWMNNEGWVEKKEFLTHTWFKPPR